MPPVELRPITVLVGRNSSGKSTFLRALPLLRQSLTTRTSSPILWFGDWVDFGDFENAVHNRSTDLPVSFHFGLDSVDPDRGAYFFIEEELGVNSRQAVRFGPVSLSISILKHRSGTRVSQINLHDSMNDVQYDLKVDEAGVISSVLVDGTEMIKALGDWIMRVSPASILPKLQLSPTQQAIADLSETPKKWEQNPIRRALGDIIGPRLDKRTKGESLGRLVSLMTDLDKVSKESMLALETKSPRRSWGKFVRDVGGADRKGLYPDLRRLLLLLLLRRTLNSTGRQLQELLSSVLYIGPARARSDRYYRYQDLSVSEIDPDGKNFPMFLNSLTDGQMEKFSTWVRGLFGYGVKVGKEQGHITINLLYKDSSVNIVDTGYGVSQILPVLGQVWWANNKPRSARLGDTALILAIEQPELHLHPAHQAMLADAFVSGLQVPTRSRRQGREEVTHFVLETHSETMINRLGALIGEKRLAARDVQILLFHADDAHGSNTRVERVHFDEEGQLVNWPYDFFLPDT